MRVDSTFLLTLANVFDNLSAGWFGAALIVPVFSGGPTSFNLLALISDLTSGMVCFVIAYKLRKREGKK